MDKNLLQRSVSGIIYVAVLVFCVHPQGAEWFSRITSINVEQHHLYFGLITFFSAVSVYECVKMMKFGAGYEKWVVFPLAAFVYYLFAKRYFSFGFYYDFRLTELLCVGLLGIAALTLFRYKNELYFDSGKLIFTVIYTAIPFGLALGLPKYSVQRNFFTAEVLYLFILIWSSDTFAYIAGRLFGKHKMAPKISPKKTWEGFAGGLILTVLLAFGIEHYQPDLRGNWIVVGLLVAVFAPLGDLMESQLKRNFGVKDSGTLIPGHGGVLDRLDSFILCVPVVYLYFMLERL